MWSRYARKKGIEDDGRSSSKASVRYRSPHKALLLCMPRDRHRDRHEPGRPASKYMAMNNVHRLPIDKLHTWSRCVSSRDALSSLAAARQSVGLVKLRKGKVGKYVMVLKLHIKGRKPKGRKPLPKAQRLRPYCKRVCKDEHRKEGTIQDMKGDRICCCV